MPDIYDIDYNTHGVMLTPPDKRGDRNVAWIRSMLKPVQWVRDALFDTYRNSFTGDAYDNTATYAKGDRVRYIDRAVYECIEATTAGTAPSDTDHWIKIQDLYIGLKERAKYNSGKMLFEYMLNKWFEVAAAPADQIYIENNTVDVNGFYLGYSDTWQSGQLGNQFNQQHYLGAASAYATDPNCFTIYVPVAVYTALGSTNDERDNVVKSFADQYVLAGMIYNIQSY